MYGLDWIDEEQLCDVTARIFGNFTFDPQNLPSAQTPDPFTLLTQSSITHISLEDALKFEVVRKLNKTISNKIGSWHQAVLGLASGWSDLGASGRVYDLEVYDSEGKLTHIVEVKNRFNTIRGAEQQTIWDNLEKMSRAQRVTAYLVQIVPKKPQRYDIPWKVSGREAKERVRCCDGATAYEWAFGRKNALYELYVAFPKVLSDVLDFDVEFDEMKLEALFKSSMPV